MLKIEHEFISGDTISWSDENTLAQQFDVHANQIKLWCDQLLSGAKEVFIREGKAAKPEPTIDVKILCAKIGELTLENDFLKTALSKAGLLSGNK